MTRALPEYLAPSSKHGTLRRRRVERARREAKALIDAEDAARKAKTDRLKRTVSKHYPEDP